MKKTSTLIILALATIVCNAGNPTTKGIFGFTQNKGQVIDQNNKLNPAVKYLFNSAGLNVQLRSNGFSYDTYTIERKKNSSVSLQVGGQEELEEDLTYHYHRIDIEFIGANTSPQILADQPLKEYTNYYTTGTPEEGVLNVKTFQKVTYINLYEGIDLEFHLTPNRASRDGSSSPSGRLGGVKYNFIIHPGADASQIKWKYNGAFNTTLQDGKIILAIEQGSMEEKIPTSFIDETSQKLNISYVSLSDNTFGFSIPVYDKHTTLIIDPVPWATYFGGSGDEAINKIVRDSAGNLIIAGFSSSTSNVATSGAFQTTYGGGTMDMLLAKFTSSGALVWSTYYGSTLIEVAYNLTIDRSGNFLVVGKTSSTSGIATAGAYQTTYGGGTMDAMVLKLTSSGSRTWASYYGGSADDYGYGIVSDTAGNIFITGYTRSLTGIATAGSYQPASASTASGLNEVFLVKMNTSGSSISWGTYYGGTNEDFAQNMAIDSAGNVLLTGYTSSSSGIATTGAYQTSWNGNSNYDAFLVKFSNAGALVWGTYYGGALEDAGTSLAVSGSNIILSGRTVSTSGIASSGAYQTAYGGGLYDAFIVVFNYAGVRQWATYFGGSNSDYSRGVLGDRFGNILVTGHTQSTSGIATTGVNQTTLAGTQDGFLSKFSSSGSLLWSTYFGGNAADGGGSVVTDSIGNVFVAGSTQSTAGIATAGAYQTALSGVNDALLVAFTSTGGLPVNLTSFTAHKQNNDVLLKWQTASELNNDRFEIERSMSGAQCLHNEATLHETVSCSERSAQLWEVIGTVKGNGTTNALSNYDFNDNLNTSILTYPNTIYYRLKQIDADGKFEYSDIAAVNFDKTDANELRIYPNPNNGIFNIQTNSSESNSVIEVYDIIGNKIHQQVVTASTSQINLSHLGKGMYLLKYFANGEMITRKMIVE